MQRYRILRRAPRWVATGLSLLLLAACGGAEPAGGEVAPTPGTAAGARTTAPRELAADPAPEPPAVPGAMAPHLAATTDGEVLLSWLEAAGEGQRLRLARFAEGAWSEAVTVAAGEGFFANWADVPSVVEGGEGELVAHWLAKLGGGTYAYGVQLARSTDGGASWQPLGLLHADRSPTEHGFVTLVPVPGGGVEAVWLDGRATAAGGAMALRSRRLPAAGSGPGAETAAGRAGSAGAEAVIDPRVCDCCSTAAVATRRGLLVAYRDRSEDEVRDISVALGAGDGWSPPRPLHRDGWTIAGCPVNGPALAAAGDEIAAAWFTAADGRPRVLAARSADGGATWSPPVEVDGEEPLGRVGVALAPDRTAVVSWLAADGGVRLVRVAADGGLAAPVVLAVTATSRASGVPKLAAAGDRLHVAWVEAEDDQPRQLRFAVLPFAALPR